MHAGDQRLLTDGRRRVADAGLRLSLREVAGAHAVPEAQVAACRHERRGIGGAVERHEPLVALAADAGRSQQRLGGVDMGNELVVRMGIRHEITRRRVAGQRRGALIARHERHGVEQHGRTPTHVRSAGVRSPVPVTIPPTVGATSSNIAPSSSNAAPSASSKAPSAPSVTRAPTLRPAKLSGPLRMMLSAGDGARPSTGARAASRGSGSSMPRPSATLDASSSDTLRSPATIRIRMASVSTLLSSNTNASAMWVCSMSVWLSQNWRAWL
jgi:hypothetical protein